MTLGPTRPLCMRRAREAFSVLFGLWASWGLESAGAFLHIICLFDVLVRVLHRLAVCSFQFF